MKNLVSMLILCCSCSVFKHRTENRSSQTELTVHAAQRRDSLQLTAQVQRLRLLTNDRLDIIDIIPTGKFVYRPDSGFAGEAAQVRVYRQNKQQLLEKDTALFNLSGYSDRSTADNVLHQQEEQQLDEQKASKPVSVWVYMLAVLVLLAINFGWKKG